MHKANKNIAGDFPANDMYSCQWNKTKFYSVLKCSTCLFPLETFQLKKHGMNASVWTVLTNMMSSDISRCRGKYKLQSRSVHFVLWYSQRHICWHGNLVLPLHSLPGSTSLLCINSQNVSALKIDSCSNFLKPKREYCQVATGTFQIFISACQLLCKPLKFITRPAAKETALCSKPSWFV